MVTQGAAYWDSGSRPVKADSSCASATTAAACAVARGDAGGQFLLKTRSCLRRSDELALRRSRHGHGRGPLDCHADAPVLPPDAAGWMPPGPRLIGGGTVRSSRAVGCLRTARPLVGQRRRWGSLLDGRRCLASLARAGQTTSPGRWGAVVTIGLCASASRTAPGCPSVVTTRDQAVRPSAITTLGDGTPGHSTRSGAVGHERPTAPGRVRTACVAAAAHPVAEGGAGGRFLRASCSRLRRSTPISVWSVVRPARACPDAYVPAALPPPVRSEGSPPVLGAPVLANGTPVEVLTLTGPGVGSWRSVRPTRQVVSHDR